MEKKQKISGTLENLNRINRLPVPVIHHVLSFLPVQEVVQTCVLSRGWRNLWCSVPTLDFDEQLNGGDFSKFFNKVLILRDGSDIEKFRLNLHQKNLYHSNSKVNNWILYAIRHNVQILGLQNTHEKYIHLNSQIFTCESLTELYLYHASIHLPESVCLPALSVLHLRSVYFKDEYLDEGLFSACPSLENLTLENCDFECDMLSITASELTNLRMKGLFPSSIVISAPNLVSLELIINNELPLNLMFNGDLKALSHANVDVKLDSFDLTTELISIIKHARYLTFSACFLQSIISAELHKHVPILSCIIQTPFFNLKWLKIGTTFRNDESIVINNILRHSPEIESVFFVNDVENNGEDVDEDEDEDDNDNDGDDDDDDEDEDDDDNDNDDGAGYNVNKRKLVEEAWSLCKLLHLKLVEMQGFQGSQIEVKVVKFFLENAIVLERMIITVSKSDQWIPIDKQGMMRIGRELLKHPRASSSVGILFLHDL